MSNIYFLGKPLFIWFGILAFISVIITAIFGLKMRTFGLKKHKISAFISIILILLHLFFGALKWIF